MKVEMLRLKQSAISKLIFLCLITTSIAVTVSVSKYKTSAYGSDSAKVATFVVDAVGSGDNNIELNCNDNNVAANYDIIVTNEQNDKVSEVAMKYDIIVELSQTLPSEMEISLSADDGSKSYSGGKTTYTFENVGQFTAGNSDTRTHTLVLKTSTNIKDNYNGTLKVFVYGEQID